LGREIESITNRALGETKIAQEKYSTTSRNAAKSLKRKYSALQTAHNKAVKTQILEDGRIRYYGPESASATSGPTRGTSYVTEYNPKRVKLKVGWEAVII
jgi:hypothetical protein